MKFDAFQIPGIPINVPENFYKYPADILHKAYEGAESLKIYQFLNSASIEHYLLVFADASLRVLIEF